MHLQNCAFFPMIRGFHFYIFNIFTFNFFFHNHRNATQSSTNGADDASHPWLSSLSLEIVQVVRCKCVSIRYCIVYLVCRFFLHFFPFRLRIVKWTNELKDTHKRLECSTFNVRINTEPKHICLSLWFYRWITIRRQSTTKIPAAAYTHCIWNFRPCCSIM